MVPDSATTSLRFPQEKSQSTEQQSWPQKHCHTCQMLLASRDIFFYNDNPFCSPACRAKQMAKDRDDRNQKRGRDAPYSSAFSGDNAVQQEVSPRQKSYLKGWESRGNRYNRFHR